MGRRKIYTEEEKKKRNLESIKRYQRTPYGRANHLLNAYRQHDREANRGECNLTEQWLIENIFSKPCVHCGKTGWDVVGCNRLDNSKPHTIDNVEPCCFDCNRKLKKNKKKEVTIFSKKRFFKLFRFKVELSISINKM